MTAPKRPRGRPRQAHGELAVNGTLRLYPSTWELLARLAIQAGVTERELVTRLLEREDRRVRRAQRRALAALVGGE